MGLEEQLALIGFAARLGTSVYYEEEVMDDGTTEKEAELLMGLMMSPKQTNAANHNHHLELINATDSKQQFKPTPLLPLMLEETKRPFSFSCPSLSLRHNDASSMSSPPPHILLARPLTVDDRDCIRLSSEAMGRNICHSFQTALDWRRDSWVASLSNDLINRHSNLSQSQLLETPQAIVLACLKHMHKINVVEARTSFKVSSQPWHSPSHAAPPMPHTFTYVLWFRTVLSLETPAGYSHVTLEAPGCIQGSFEPRTTLRHVNIQLDTRVLSAMIEKATRILVRSSVEAFFAVPPQQQQQQQQPSSASTSSASDSDESIFISPRAVATPNARTTTTAPSPTHEPTRLVSPQPGSSPEMMMGVHSHSMQSPPPATHIPLVSPPPKPHDYFRVDSSGPSLPALVEVACAAMSTTSV